MAEAQTAAPPPVGPPPRISYPLLMAVMWTLCGLAAAFVIARLVIRKMYAGRFYADDYLTIAAFAILLGNVSLETWLSPTRYLIMGVSTGRMAPTPDFLDKVYQFNNAQFAFTFLFWTGLWTVKAAFLAFFYRLTYQLTWPRRAWWAIVVFAVLTYIGCVVSYIFACSSPGGGVQCAASEEGTRLTLVSLTYSTAVDIIIDVLIIALPISLTIGLNMNWTQKIALIGVLALGALVAVFAVLRAVFNGSNSRTPELSWLTLWTAIEMSVAVIVVCLSSFKVLFSVAKKSSSSSPYVDLSGGRYGASGYVYNSRATTKSGGGRRATGNRSRAEGTGLDAMDTDLDMELRAMGGTHKDLASDRGPNITVTRSYAVTGVEKHGDERPVKDTESQESILR